MVGSPLLCISVCGYEYEYGWFGMAKGKSMDCKSERGRFGWVVEKRKGWLELKVKDVRKSELGPESKLFCVFSVQWAQLNELKGQQKEGKEKGRKVANQNDVPVPV